MQIRVALIAALVALSVTPALAAKSPPPLIAEAASAAAGDIPDNQVFLAYRNAAGAYAIKYPEGWARSGRGNSVTFRDKNNIVRIVVGSGSAPTPARVAREVATLRGAHVRGAPRTLQLPSGAAVEITYTTETAPSPVTGKRVTLTVDRYYIAGSGGRRAVLDLGTPVGVDNVDAFRLMAQSFRWR